MSFAVEYTGLTQLRTRISAVGGRVAEALETETRRQMDLMVDAVRSNIAADFRNPGRMQSAVGSRTQRAGDVITGELDASGQLTETPLPFMGIQEAGGTTRPHVIEARSGGVLAFFWEREGVMFFGRRVNHPGSRIVGRHFVKNAFDAHRAETVLAFRQVLNATVQGVIEALTSSQGSWRA